MLFNKKQFMITEKQIKEDIKNRDGEILIKLNLRYPEIKCPKNHPMSKFACKFYSELPKTFVQYAKGELLSAAQTVYAGKREDFTPFSVLMKWENTFENTNYLSIVVDFLVCDGINPPFLERKTQIWNKVSGLKCRFDDLIRRDKFKEAISKILDKDQIRRLNKDLFVLRENSIDFYMIEKNGYKTISFSKNELSEIPTHS